MVVDSGDGEQWIHAADSIVELLSRLNQQTDLTAEFFLLCLEVRQRMYTR